MTTPDTVRARVSDEMIELALHARVPGGSEVWCWLPQKDAWTPHETARDVMRCALEAALASRDEAGGEWVGKQVRKIKGLPFGNGGALVVADYGEGEDRRLVVRHPEGWQHIFSPSQLEVVDPPRTLSVTYRGEE